MFLIYQFQIFVKKPIEAQIYLQIDFHVFDNKIIIKHRELQEDRQLLRVT